MRQTLELKMITLTQLTQDLQIGKSKLYRLMKELEINPHQDGRRSLLDKEQFQKIQQAILRLLVFIYLITQCLIK